MNARTQNGFSLVELMIAMTLGLILTTGLISIFINNRHSFDRDDVILSMQDDARHAIRELVNDLTMAGLWADLILPASIVPDTSLAVGIDCGPAAAADWIYRAVIPGTSQSESLTMVDNATVASANASFSCLGAEIVPGTDIVAIKRVAGARAPMALTDDTVYLRTNGTVGLLFQEPADVPPVVPVPVPFSDWEYRPSIYYIRNFAIVAGDGIPTLCRKVLDFGPVPNMVTDCLAQGVEDLQVEVGLDSNGDGNPNVYLPNPTPAQMQNAVSARVFVLARSTQPDIKYTNEKVYSISNAPVYAPDDNFYRRVFSIVVGLRNLKALTNLGG
ncbi:MAG: PilW family protein [Gammaproteobacteria bacterium]